MSEEENIEKISSVTSAKGDNKIVKGQELSGERAEPNRELFDAHMRSDTMLQAKKSEHAGKVASPMDEVRNLNRQVDSAAKANPMELAGKSKELIAQIEELKFRLTDPQYEIKNDAKQVLRNKLEYIDENLRIALDKAGLEYIPPDMLEGGGKTPVERFLSLLSNGQDQLKTLGGELQRIGETRTHISPANLLMVQLKVNTIQQEIELFTSLLNKALESVKTIMNVQV